MFLVIKAGNFRTVGFKMVRQHIVDVAGQRYLAATDDTAYGLYRGVKILADIDHFARSGGYFGFPDKQRFVIRFLTALASGFLFRFFRRLGWFRWWHGLFPDAFLRFPHERIVIRRLIGQERSDYRFLVYIFFFYSLPHVPMR